MSNSKTYGKVKSLLSISLYRLVLTKNYEDITIQDICKLANVSRMSFYRFYSSKDDILTDFCDEKFEEFIDEISSIEDVNITLIINKLFEYFQRYQRELLILKKAGRTQLLNEALGNYSFYIINHFKELKIPHSIEGKYFADFLTGGIFSVCMSWLENDCSTPIDEMANAIISLIKTYVI